MDYPFSILQIRVKGTDFVVFGLFNPVFYSQKLTSKYHLASILDIFTSADYTLFAKAACQKNIFTGENQ